MTEYGGEENIPLEVYINDLLAINPLIRGLVEAYADPYTGYAAELMDIDPDDVETFYYESCESSNRSMRIMTRLRSAPNPQKSIINLLIKSETAPW